MSTAVGQQAVLRLIQSKQATSQIELARALDLPANTVHGIVSRLNADGVIVETRQERGSRGRPSHHFAICLPHRVLVIIWWGTEWQGCIIGEELPTDFEIHHFRTPMVDDINAARIHFVKMRDEILASHHLQVEDLDGAIVLINSGKVTGGVVESSSVVPVAYEFTEGMLSQLLECKTFLSTKSHLAELELRCWIRDHVRSLVNFNVADGVSSHFASVVGTGIQVIPGQIGHTIRHPCGEICGCGNRGCLETLISGPRLIRKVRSEIANGVHTVLSDSLTKPPSKFFNDLEIAESRNDPYARTVVHDFLENCVWGISAAVNLFRPDIVVLSGYALAGREAWRKRLAELLPTRILAVDGAPLKLEFERKQTGDHFRELATEFLLRKKDMALS